FPSTGRPHRLLASQLESAIGRGELAVLARRAAFPTGMFAVVAADLLPGLLDVMEQDARRVQSLEAAARTRRTGPAPVPSAVRGSVLRGLSWVLVAGALLCLTGWIHQKTRVIPAGTTGAERQTSPRLSLVNHGGIIDVRGRLPGEADRRKVWSALVGQYGQARVSGDIQRDPHAQAPRWLDRLLTLTPVLRHPGLSLSFSGDTLHVDMAELPDADRVAVSETLRRGFGHLHVTGLWDPGRVALARLPATPEPSRLVDALNQGAIRFEHKSPVVRADGMDMLRASALAIRAADPALRLEVASHTDSLGTADSNLRLSQQRAEAVVAELQALGVPSSALVPRGYGEEQPVADNRLEAGRERNRRIEYSVLE
ncbi:OmpA family protein, partial [Stenotrophomonas sp.]|uniref:OmpA family protein n=1 Tax=Stenotrophomonas sp. TaxID=69392 RepID=UPI0028AB0B4B